MTNGLIGAGVVVSCLIIGFSAGLAFKQSPLQSCHPTFSVALPQPDSERI